MAWGKEDSEKGGVRGRIGKWLMKQALKLIPVEQRRSFHWYPDGYSSGEDGKQRVVISDDPVKYWGDQSEDRHKVYAVRHNTDGILGIFWLWTEARDAAALLSQEYEDYHFREYILNEDKERIVIAENEIDSLEQNLSVESIPLYNEFDYDEWSKESRVINSDNIRSKAELLENDTNVAIEQL